MAEVGQCLDYLVFISKVPSLWGKLCKPDNYFSRGVISDVKVAAILLPTFLPAEPGTDFWGLPLISKSNILDTNFCAVQDMTHRVHCGYQP